MTARSGRPHAPRPHAPRPAGRLSLSRVHDLSSTAGIVAIAAGAVAVVTFAITVVLAFRLRRVRADQRAVLGGRQPGPRRPRRGAAGAVRGALAVRAGRGRPPRRPHEGCRDPSRRGDRLPGARALRRLRRDVRPPVDLDRPARRHPFRGGAVLDSPSRPGAPVRQAGPERAAASSSSRRRRTRRSGSRSRAAGRHSPHRRGL